ncbi:MAG: GAF domain-containing protein [Gammaproteobacteria bacterium]|nr:MAG: GAF domain-containing protein [Gammaproteobacteria bacterium]UCH40627.1 MAG: GAF domain-containing protein [Gammaproteobacteria bacterium]
MKSPDNPANEKERRKDLRSLNILDTRPEERFDRLTRMAKRIIDVDIALVSLVDENRQWFKSKVRLDACETGRDITFCGHAILGNKIFIIEDARDDERFFDKPLVTGPPNIRFYAGTSLRYMNGN